MPKSISLNWIRARLDTTAHSRSTQARLEARPGTIPPTLKAFQTEGVQKRKGVQEEGGGNEATSSARWSLSPTFLVSRPTFFFFIILEPRVE